MTWIFRLIAGQKEIRRNYNGITNSIYYFVSSMYEKSEFKDGRYCIPGNGADTEEGAEDPKPVY
jgi:hypothetical protein